MYYINDSVFCDEIEEYIEYILLVEVDKLKDLPDDYVLTVEDCYPRKIFQLNSEILGDMIEDMYFSDNHSEDGGEWDDIEDILKKHINFEELNKDIPSLWFPNGKIEKYTKIQLIELHNNK